MKDETGITWTTVGTHVLLADGGRYGKCLDFRTGGEGYLTTPGTQPDFQFGTGDFTIECWIKTAVADERYIIDTWPTNGSQKGWQLGVKDGKFVFVTVGPGYLITGMRTISDNKWHHVAVCRKAGTVRAFVDGHIAGEAACNDNFMNADTPLVGLGGQISRRNSKFDYIGQIDELLIVKGQALHWNAFIPNTQPYAKDYGEPEHFDQDYLHVAFLDFESTATDDAAGRISWINGTTAAGIDTAEKHTGTGSFTYKAVNMGANRWADGLHAKLNSDLVPQNQPHTLEAWVKLDPVKLKAARDSGAQMGSVFHQANGGGNSDQMFAIRYPDVAHPKLGYYNGPTHADYIASGDVTVGVWHHVAFDFDGSAVRLFLDGTMQYKWTDTNGWRFDFSERFNIGLAIVNGYESYSSGFPGWIDDVRISRTSRYGHDAPFVPSKSTTPPAKLPLPTVTATPGWKIDFENGLNDSEGTAWTKGGNTFEVVALDGRPHVAHADRGYITKTFTSDALTLGAGDFTIEFLVRPDGQGQMCLMDGRDVMGAWLEINGWIPHFPAGDRANTTPLAPRVWSHVAFVRKTGILRTFINGQIVAQTDSTKNFTGTGHGCSVGGVGDGTLPFFGHLDNFRIYKGTAVYWDDFSIPPLLQV